MTCLRNEFSHGLGQKRTSTKLRSGAVRVIPATRFEGLVHADALSAGDGLMPVHSFASTEPPGYYTSPLNAGPPDSGHLIATLSVTLQE
jgi:hypothetical protein